MPILNSRQSRILERVNEHGQVQVNDLADYFSVSQATIRSDLRRLEEEKKLVRVHGGARRSTPLASEKSTEFKLGESIAAKKAIAKAAGALLKDGDTAFLASGSTVHTFAASLDDSIHLDVVTPAIDIAYALLSKKNIRVHICGGVLYRNSLSVRGEYSEELLDSLNIPVCFIGADGIATDGVSCSSPEEAMFTRKLLRNSLRRVVLADSRKFGQRGIGRICPLEEIDTVISDAGIPDGFATLLRDKGIELIIAENNEQD